ncbi:UNVERIFIED_CONTAM: hypothetical protein ABID98_001708 [Brevibacillus sp. OAP136]
MKQPLELHMQFCASMINSDYSVKGVKPMSFPTILLQQPVIGEKEGRFCLRPNTFRLMITTSWCV